MSDSMSKRGWGIAGLAAALAVVAAAAPAVAMATPAAPAAAKPDGWSDKSYYLAMPDGVKLAVSLWLPKDLAARGRVPVVLIQTRYGRAGTFIHGENGRYRDLPAAGYAVAIVDTRGSTSSFGDRKVEIGPEEIADMDVLIRHFRTQPWANGEVLATGVSYMADTADIATASPAKLTGSVIRESDFDAYLGLFNPGGVANDFMMNLWGGDTLLRDFGKSLATGDGLDCVKRAEDCAKLWPRLQPVDDDPDFAQMRAAMRVRQHWAPDDYRTVAYRDDKALNGYGMWASSPAASLAGMKRENVPVQYWGSWMDAGTGDAALARYRSMPDTPIEVWITGNNHGGDVLTDPFFAAKTAPVPSFDQQWGTITGFMATVRAGKPPQRSIHYYVLGTGAFRQTAQWPPADAKPLVLRLAEGGRLARPGEAVKDGADRYAVDFTATTGEATRWTTQIGTPAVYPDRRAADAKLQTYTTAPFAVDTEVVGTPALTLFMASATTDPAVFAYLEDIGPDGTVTYLTEGLFRAVHRKPADPAKLPYAQPEPAKSYLRADGRPMTPGVVEEVSFPLFSVAARIRAGHALRVSLAGADVSAFHRYSEGKPDSWTIERTAARPSRLVINARPWSGQ